MKDYAFNIHILAGDLERGVLTPVDDNSSDDGRLDGSGFGSSSVSNGGTPAAATTSA
jgi:hypothetical protein